jgi:3'-5' exonuclease
VYLDRPKQEGPTYLARLGLRPTIQFQVAREHIVIVNTEAECDAAVGHLRPAEQLYFDTEHVVVLGDKRRTTGAADVLQICGGEGPCFVFQIRRWRKCYPSLVALLRNRTSTKVAHFAKHDVDALNKRFPGIAVTSTVELSSQVPPGLLRRAKDKALASITEAVLGQWLDKDMDHSSWDAENLSWKQIHYAAADVAVLREIVRTANEARDEGDLVGAAEALSLPIDNEDAEEADNGAGGDSDRAGGVPPPAEVRDDERSTPAGFDGADLAPLGPELLLFQSCSLRVVAYAQSGEVAELRLPCGLNRHLRKALHELASGLKLHSRSVGEGNLDSVDRAKGSIVVREAKQKLRLEAAQRRGGDGGDAITVKPFQSQLPEFYTTFHSGGKYIVLE